MPRRRPSPLTAALVAILGVAGALGAMAPGSQAAAASVTPVLPAAGTVSAEYAAAATTRRETRSTKPRPAGRHLGGVTADASLLSYSQLADTLARQARHQELMAARAAARRARERQQFLDRWVMPIQYYNWSAGFGEAGYMWSTGYHTGQDWTAPYGTPVYAAARGTITFASWGDAYGNKLVITHPDGTQTWYAHLAEFERTSGPVAAGELVGAVGCTGNCYGNHLHFEVHLGGVDDVDPVDWLREHDVPV